MTTRRLSLGLRSALRAGALAITAVALAASERLPCGHRVRTLDSAQFDAATSCGPAGVVRLLTEEEGDDGCNEKIAVRADGGPAVGLPATGAITYTDRGEIDYPGDSLLRARITLEGDVALPDAFPATTVARTCRTQRTSRDVLSVACEGPDPEAACSGTLSIRPVTP